MKVYGSLPYNTAMREDSQDLARESPFLIAPRSTIACVEGPMFTNPSNLCPSNPLKSGIEIRAKSLFDVQLFSKRVVEGGEFLMVRKG